MSEGLLTFLGVLLAALATAWAAYLTYKGNKDVWKLQAAVEVLQAQIKTLEAATENQKESARKSDEVHAAELKAVNTILEAERELRRKSDTANEAVIIGLKEQITSLTLQLDKANAELADVKKQSNERIVALEQQIRDLVQAKTQPQDPILATAQ